MTNAPINMDLLREIAAEFELDKDGVKYDWFNVSAEELERFKQRTFPKRYHQDVMFFHTLSDAEKDRRKLVFVEFRNIIDEIKLMYEPGYEYRQAWSAHYMAGPGGGADTVEVPEEESDTEQPAPTGQPAAKAKQLAKPEKKKKTGPYKYVYWIAKDKKGRVMQYRKKVYLEDEKKKAKAKKESASTPSSPVDAKKKK